MCKRLILLLSFIVLLTLVNGAFADDCGWIGPNPFPSFCGPTNWDPPVVPGPDDDVWIDCCNGEGDVVIDCDVTVNGLQWPGPESCDCSTTISVGADFVCSSWSADFAGTKTANLFMTGGTFTVSSGGDSVQLCDDGGDSTFAYFNFLGAGTINLGGCLRSGDNGGNIYITIGDDVLVNVADYGRIGDDGGGWWKFRGNCSANFLGKYEDADTGLQTGCRDKSADLYVQDNAKVYVAYTLMLNKYSDSVGHAYVSGGVLNVNKLMMKTNSNLDMTGGLIICRDSLRVGEVAHIQLDGGEIQVFGDLLMDDGGSIDICGGVLKFKGNRVMELMQWVCGPYEGITGCGSAQCLIVEYDGIWTILRFDPDCNPDRAYCPSPPDGAEQVRPLLLVDEGIQLCWLPGGCVGNRGAHCIFFGTDYEEVRDAERGPIPLGVFKGCQRADQTCWPKPTDPEYPLHPPLWTTYYWRIDEHCQDGSVVRGKVWRFTTGCKLIPGDTNLDCLVNFEDFACVAETFLQQQLWPEEE